MRRRPFQLPPRVITAFEMQRRPAAFQREALQAPVTITSNGEPTLVAMSVAEYQRLRACARGAEESTERAYARVVNRSDALERLRDHRDVLTRLGVAHLALFGSVARDQADDLSDVDVVVDTTDGTAPGLFKLGEIADQLEHILGRSVDVISRAGLEHTKKLKHRVAADLVNVF
ncbi:MAG: type II toxin-antitoxin system prevent-host-death family antitoxin [Alphaproteobacteria bacterium]|nr:type II toxin-antitoxin system prevent-host-death family antitoxin [Alphaproteobacteria bacterium]